MGGSAGGALAAAVSRSGGFGMVGGGDREWLDRELPIVAADAGGPWGVGFLTWAVTSGVVEHALAYEPSAVMLSFGDPTPFAEIIRKAGAALILQVTDLEEARQAADLGADVIVAQGTEAGGHGARRGRSTLPFVPVVVDLAGSMPVLAAGGIADGRGIAAVHPYLDRWRGREAELAGDPEAGRDYQRDVERGVIPPLPVWAGEGVDLITEVISAEDLVTALVAEAEIALARAGRG